MPYFIYLERVTGYNRMITITNPDGSIMSTWKGPCENSLKKVIIQQTPHIFSAVASQNGQAFICNYAGSIPFKTRKDELYVSLWKGSKVIIDSRSRA